MSEIHDVPPSPVLGIQLVGDVLSFFGRGISALLVLLFLRVENGKNEFGMHSSDYKP